jgi:hypothetical protein
MKIFAILIASIAAVAGVSGQQTYEMRCRGGFGLTLQGPPPSWAIDATGKTVVQMTLRFVGGPQREKIGPDGTRLGPGHCSWADRDLRPGEPTVIKFDLLRTNFERKVAGPGYTRDEVNWSIEQYPDSQTLPGYLASPNHYWSFRVYNTGKGYLQGTSSQAFKPALNTGGRDTPIRH